MVVLAAPEFLKRTRPYPLRWKDAIGERMAGASNYIHLSWYLKLLKKLFLAHYVSRIVVLFAQTRMIAFRAEGEAEGGSQGEASVRASHT